MFETKTRDLGGRIGRLKTPHGVLETPFLFPVVDPIRQVPSINVIRNIGFNGFITNAYLFYKRNKGLAKSIHSELSWSNVIMTDSGGYQILIYGDIDIDNKTIVNYEKRIGTDIAVILDIPTGSRMNYNEALDAVNETYRRGLEALPLIMDSDQLWVYPVQGAPYRELLIYSAVKASKLPYDIYAIGSPTVMLEKYKYSKLIDLVLTARAHLPPSKPLHVFGVGHPMIIPFLVAVGGDLFDSASYILYARDGRYIVETGTKNIRELTYFPCNCPVCSRYTPREVLDLPSSKRTEIIATHNLYMLAKEMNTVKQAIKEGRLWELLEYRAKGHPALLEAFTVLKQRVKYLEKTSPLTNPGGKALLIYDSESYWNPKLRLNAKKSLEIAISESSGKTVVLIPAYRKPYNTQPEYVEISSRIPGHDNVLVAFIHPYLGVVKPELASTYPFYQHECRITRRTLNVGGIAMFINKLLESDIRKIIIIESGWFSKELFLDLTKFLGKMKERVTICKLNEFSSQILQ
ncbi:MAG: tRNA guanosine(15) transglycosylase TgtA [Desulfurococcaceae archaeon]